WFRRECAGGESFEALNDQAAKVPIGCRGVTMLPHFDGMISPTPDAAMRGLFANLTLQHTRAEMYRAILEALAFSLRENMELLRRHGLAPETIRCIGGGARNDLWLQMKADVIGMAVEKPAVTEASVLGAAMLAAWGAGLVPRRAGAFHALAETSAAWYHAQRIFSPDENSHRQYEAPYRRYRDLTTKAPCR
ncbi:MAG: carbohydrate kinase, partial [Lentisphaerae bacterium]|nr:carbohydrate kinase [Lentisphaerota bacterium]